MYGRLHVGPDKHLKLQVDLNGKLSEQGLEATSPNFHTILSKEHLI